MNEQQKQLLKKKIEDLYTKLAELKKEKRELKEKAAEWKEKREHLREEIRKIKEEITTLKKKRNELNEKVKNLKELRNDSRSLRKEKINEIVKLKQKLKVIIKNKPKKSMKKIKEEIESLEWKLQTTPLTAEEEKPLIEKLKKLNIELKIHEQIKELKENLVELQAEVKALEAKAQKYHEEMTIIAEKSQEFHERITGLVNKIKELKKEADNAHKEFLRFKVEIKDKSGKQAKIFDEIKALKAKLHEIEREETVKLEKEALKSVEERAKEKLKRGEKLTWEEFKVLAEKGII